MPILVGIDGSWSDLLPSANRDANYDRDFTTSFVRRICMGRASPNTRYIRGPRMLGGGLMQAVSEATEFVRERRRAGVNEPVLMTGYSRGAAGVVAAAARLRSNDIAVKALLLFDCVDRHVAIDAEVIPSNVGHVMHVIRDPRTSSRESFSNDGLKYRPPTVYEPVLKFMCTHGGMGGCPWQAPAGTSPHALIDEGGLDGGTNVSYLQDASVSATVWASVTPFMSRHGYS